MIVCSLLCSGTCSGSSYITVYITKCCVNLSSCSFVPSDTIQGMYSYHTIYNNSPTAVSFYISIAYPIYYTNVAKSKKIVQYSKNHHNTCVATYTSFYRNSVCCCYSCLHTSFILRNAGFYLR